MSLSVDPVKCRLLERLWSIGYAEAALRHQSPHGKLDALLEATVWIADAFAPPGTDYYLSHVGLYNSTDDTILKSSLAEFDDDLKSSLQKVIPQLTIPIGATDGLSIGVPLPLPFKDILKSLWDEALKRLPIQIDLIPAADDRIFPKEIPDADIQEQFQENLRVAFGTIFDSISGTRFHSGVPFTLQLQWGDVPRKVTTNHHVHFTLGYCLSEHTRYHFLKRHQELKPDLLDKLELPFQADSKIRSQSHSFVESGFSGQILNHKNRYEGTTAIPPDPKFEVVQNIEGLMWEIRPTDSDNRRYDNLFMMPLVKYSSGRNRPLAVAHWYLQTPSTANDPNLLVPMAHARHRATALFFEVLHRSYREAVADEVARATASRDWDADVESRLERLNQRLRMISAAYGQPPDYIQVCKHITDEHPSLWDKLQDQHLPHYRSGSLEFTSDHEKRLKALDLCCAVAVNEHEALDLILRLRDKMSVLLNQGSRLTLARDLHARLSEINLAIASVRQDMSDHLQPGDSEWEMLHGFRFAYDNRPRQPPCLCGLNNPSTPAANDRRPLPDYPNRLFLDVHEVRNCCVERHEKDLAAEIDRRLAHLFGTPHRALTVNENALLQVEWDAARTVRQRCDRFLQFCGRVASQDRYLTAFTLLKNAAKSERRGPVIATLVVMLYMLGADVSPHEHLWDSCGARLGEPPPDWPRSLAGIAKLAMGKPDEGNSPIFIDVSERCAVRFKIDGVPFADQYGEIRRRAAGGGTSSRIAQIRQVYMKSYGGLPGGDGEVNNVFMELFRKERSLSISWRRVAVQL